MEYPGLQPQKAGRIINLFMLLKDIYETDFLQLSSTDTISHLKKLLAAGHYKYIIIGNEATNQYFLEKPEDIEGHIKDFADHLTLAYILDSPASFKPVQPFDISEPVTNLPPRIIAMHNNVIVGYVNAYLEFETRNFRNLASKGIHNESPRNPFFINAHYNQSVCIDKLFHVRITLGPTPGGSGSIPVFLSLHSEMDILIIGKKNFEVKGTDHHVFHFVPGVENTSVLFKLQPLQTGKGQIRIIGYIDGMEVGHLDADVEITAAEAGNEPATFNATAIAVPSISPPDMTLQVNETESNGRISIQFRLTTSEALWPVRTYLKPYGPIKLRVDPANYFTEFFEDIELLASDDSDKTLVYDNLRARGLELFNELLPEELRNLIWSLRDRIKTLKIDSDEPWIPWELCRLSGKNGDAVDEGPFFCEAFEVSRWIPGYGVPRSRFSLNNMAIITPSDSNLYFAKEEMKDIATLLRSKKFTITPIQPRVKPVLESFQKNHDAWHFSGHGFTTAGNASAKHGILLDDQEVLYPSFIYGKSANLGSTSPFIFLNACRAGKNQMGLAGTSGWATRFLDAGASVFIAPFWNVPDELAYRFAMSLYQSLLDGNTIGRAVKDARSAIKSATDPSWLAYALFANPFARIIP